MKALIHGERICQIEEKEFPVAPTLKWVNVPDGTTTQDTYVNGKVVKYVPVFEELDIPNPLEMRIKALEEKITKVEADISTLKISK